MGHRLNYILALLLFIAAITFVLIALINDKRNWWTVMVSCFGHELPVKVEYGPLGYWLSATYSGAFSSKSSDLCYPLHTGSGPNQNLRYIGIVAVVLLAIALLFAFGAVIQSLAALFEFSHAHKHARRSSHAAIFAGVLTLIGAVLVLGWYVGAADSYTKPLPRNVEFAQILVFCAVPAYAVSNFGYFNADKHHGYSPF